MEYKLYHGDCLEIMDKLIEEGVKVDMILTDPPYGTTKCKWDDVIPFDEMWNRLNKLIKPNSAIVLFGSEPFSSSLRMSNIKKYKYDWIWEKRAVNFLNAKRQPLRNTENIIVFNSKIYNPQGLIYKERINKRSKSAETNNPHGLCNKSYFTNYPKQILKFIGERGLHPTQKPVALLEYLIKTYTNKDELVLDFTMGSGSTGVACLNTNRRFIGIELDENYFNIAKKRIEDAEKELKNK